MAIEIERKFLVTGDGWRAAAKRRLPMRQGYLAPEGGKASVRVRLEGAEARLNIKAAVVGAQRAEYEVPLPFARPPWLGREVTDDRRYYNHHLATHPYARWNKA